jgi:uncharacterized protein YkwD
MCRLPAFLLCIVAAGAFGDAGAAQPAPRAVAQPRGPERATPALSPATTCGIANLREQILRQVNALRAAGAQCGSRRMPPAPPLAWNDKLFAAAARHSMDMAAHDYFGHQDPQGRSPGDRVSAEGYDWGEVGENIAGGNDSVASVMRNWQHSPPHCQALLKPEFREFGVACVARPNTQWPTYWTMDLGRLL